MIKIRHTDEDEVIKKIKIPKGMNKYQPHQGNKERLRRLARIYHSHPNDCHCESCIMMDRLLRERGRMD